MRRLVRGFDISTTLGVTWSKRENDWMIHYPRKCDGWLIHDVIRKDEFQDLVKELDKRGYDTETLRISIKKKRGDEENERSN